MANYLPSPFFSNSTFLILSLAITLIFVSFLAITISHIQAQAPTQAQTIVGFYANLSANEEVPPTQSNASGLAVFLFSNETTELSYLVNASGLELDEITESLIYNGSAGSNGESVASLSDKSTNEESNSSIMFQGEIKKDDLNGFMQDKEIKDLVTLMSNGSAYVNIHSNQYKDGEIRGQIVMGQVQTDGNAITGLAVPGGLIGLSGITLNAGSISFSLGGGGGIIGFVPILVPGNSQTGTGSGTQTGTGSGNTVEIGNGNTVESVAEGLGGVVDKVGGIADKAVNTLSETVSETGQYVGEGVEKVSNSADDASDNVENTVKEIDERIVKKILGDDSDDSDSRDSDDSDSRDSDDSDSRDSDDSDSRDSDDSDSRDSDDSDSRDSDDSDSRDSDDEKDSDDDEKDSDDGDSVKDTVKGLLD